MRKLGFILSTVLALCSAGAYADDNSIFGGFWHMGFGTIYSPQTELNNRLSQLGYSGLSDLGLGLTYGGGGIFHNIFVGGWGYVDYGSSSASNQSVSRTIKTDVGGGGGFELGYYFGLGENFGLIPALNMIWGGRSYTFATNIDFNSYVQNPVDFAPSIGLSTMSVGIGLNALMHGKNAGVMVRVVYLYTLMNNMGHAVYLNAPALNQHSVFASVEFLMGGLGTKKEFEKRSERLKERRDSETNTNS